MDCQPVHGSSGIPSLTRCAGRIQRQIYLRPNDSAGRFLCHPTGSRPRHLSQLLSTRNPLAIHRNTPRRLTAQAATKSWVPHISLVFREMWDTTTLDLRTLEPNRHFSLRSVVSHISRKTSEIWGTLSFVAT